MANNYWKGTAPVVAQIATFVVTGYDVGTTYKVTIGDTVISVIAAGSVNATATALQVALAASTHPYFERITWTVNTATVTGTAKVSGVPFVFATSVSGGAGTIGVYTVTTASAGPNDWSTAANWSLGVVPVDTDNVIIKDSSVNILWGLAQSAVTLASLRIFKSYTGKIGLDRIVFTTTANGDTYLTTKLEYRNTYLAINSTVVKIGENEGSGNPAGSQRILLDLGTTQSTVEILGTAQTASEVGRTAIRIKAAVNTTDIFVRSAVGGVGIAVDTPGETSTVRTISVSDPTTATQVIISAGVTLTTFTQTGGNNILNAAATVTTVNVDGGVLRTEGDFTITILNIYSGSVISNHVKTAGNCITTANLYASIDFSQSNRGRTIATTNVYKGCSLKATSLVAFTALAFQSNSFTAIVSE